MLSRSCTDAQELRCRAKGECGRVARAGDDAEDAFLRQHLPVEYEEFRRFRESRRSFATVELPEDKVEAIRRSRMDPRHAHLDKLLDPK